MNIVEMKSKVDSDLNFTSANDKIKVQVSSNYGPELILEDGSSMIFNTVVGYYKVISNSDIYDMTNNSINIDYLKSSSYFKDSDDVIGVEYRNEPVNMVETYEVELIKIIRLIR